MASWNPKYTIDLIEVFNRAYSGESRSTRNALRPALKDPSFRRLYSQSVIERIRSRTSEEGKDKNNVTLKGPYSKSYADSLDFKVAGKSRGFVNLTNTGRMLSSLTNKTQDSYKLVFQLDNEEDRGKAQGHISGRLGLHGRAPRRDFLGITREEEEELLRQNISVSRQGDLSLIADLFGEESLIQDVFGASANINREALFLAEEGLLDDEF